MIVKLLTEQHLEFLSLTGGCRGSSESTLVKLLEISCRGSIPVMWCIDPLQREQEDLESKDTKQNGARNLRIREDTEKVCKKGHVGGLSNI